MEIFGDGTDYGYALAVDEEADDFYDVEESSSKKPIKITDIYEPGEIQAKMLTEEDEIIRMTDVPERMQVI